MSGVFEDQTVRPPERGGVGSGQRSRVNSDGPHRPSERYWGRRESQWRAMSRKTGPDLHLKGAWRTVAAV